MITEAIWEDKKWTKGSSRSDIRKFITQNYDVDEDKLKENMSINLSKMLDVDSKTGVSCLTKVEDLGNYKITPEWRKQWKKKAGIRPQRRKKKKDKDAPKHPRNSYLWYLQEVRESVKERYPNKDHREITLLVAEEWKALPSKKKKKYEEKAKADKERYEKEKKDYEKKKKRERRDTSDESSSESRSRSKSKSKKRRYDSESESGKSDRSKNKRRKKGSDSESSGEKKKEPRRRKEDSSSGSKEKKADSSTKKEEDKKK
jgi:hypothetical protein